ncbi:MAG: family 20 glycosylhydrolase [Clostridium sp.]|uniref:family 20 glycosylhydrolase n=1 Tax=Clostridium paraputrificum TaxID=29363 RepID=UPI00137982D5|nr:family 20 glycosylhydrolase [Clostridium paraputrificum]MDU6808755.1 family 20 glycosylhydrolase [Clostridium sp.]
MKKKKIIASMMFAAMTLGMSSQFAFAGGKDYIENPSFENAIDKDSVQLYKAERTDEKAYEGNYSIKVGNPKPTDEHEIPIWSYNYGKGSVNVVIDNVKPNTTYEVTTHYFNETGVKMSTGVLDVDGQYSTSPWKLASNIKTNQAKSTEWQTNTHTITTGPRTDQIYAFAYMEWTGNENGAGVFYFDDVEIKEVESNPEDIKTIGYEANTNGFPNTVPAIQNFSQTSGQFKLTKKNQVFSTDKFSESKAEYLADSMKAKGLIENYTINVIDDIKDAEGITLYKQPIQFELNDLSKGRECEKDAYQIDIAKDSIIIYSNYIEGIQNGSMIILQAFAQRDSLNCGIVKDYTDQNIRGLQVDSGRRYYSIDWLKKEIEQMAYYKQNVLQLRLKDNEGIRYESKVAPELVDRKGGFWTAEEIDELVNYANKFNIEIIPEVDFPGHSEQEADYHKEWKITENCSNLDFSKPEVREYILSIYEEAADLFQADTIHIGGDEYFQTKGWGDEGKAKLAAWAQEVTGNPAADHNDALKLFFNEAAKPFLDKGMKVLVWNDNMFTFDGVVDLDDRIVIDFWAGSIYGSIIASEAVDAGYNVMSSSSSNYHDLWPQQNNDKLDRPLPENLYENFTRYTYSKGAFSYPFYNVDEVLDKNLDQAQGQVFPIWDDAHGYIPEYVLSRTLFPRYAGFAYTTWGAEYDSKLSYDEFERLAYAVESPRPDLLGEQVEKNYTSADYETVVETIKKGLADIKTENPDVQKNIDELNVLLDTPNNKTLYTVEEIENLIRKYENVEYVADKGTVTVKYVDENNEDLCDPIVIEREIGEAYTTEAKSFDGYTLKTTPENAEGAIEKETQTVIYVYQKQETPVNPDNPNDGEQEDQTPGDPNGSTDSEGGDVVKTGDQTTIFTTMIIGLIALGGILVSIKSNKEKTYK